MRHESDFEAFGETTGSPQVGLDDAHPAAGEEVPELRDPIPIFAGRNRDPQLLRQRHMTIGVVGPDRFLEPGASHFFVDDTPAERLRRGEDLVGIDHQGRLRTDCVADNLDSMGILRKRATADLHLDSTEPLIHRLCTDTAEAVVVEFQPADHRVGGHTLAGRSKQSPDRLFQGPAHQVPQGEIDRGDAEQGQTGGAVVIGEPPEAVPDAANEERIGTDDLRRKLTFYQVGENGR